MNINPQFCRHALALLFFVVIATATAQAQKSADGKTVSPPSPAGAQASPPQTLPAKPVADKLAPAGWTRYEVGEPARFSLILPAVPGASAERMELMPGVAVTVRTYLSSTDSGIYGATYVDDLPAAMMNETAKRTFFEGFVKGFAEGFQKGMDANGAGGQLKWLEQRTATASGLPGYEQDLSYSVGRYQLLRALRLNFAPLRELISRKGAKMKLKAQRISQRIS
jgi:hypothetical protein